ncbi:MAG TPA: hypothetical protein VKU44_02890 [Terriglobia bacterium]|jgi:hypothetical protein|nr:hypothetical protein [Terriglobia bacterium]
MREADAADREAIYSIYSALAPSGPSFERGTTASLRPARNGVRVSRKQLGQADMLVATPI